MPILLTADATVPAIYTKSFAAVDPSSSGETSVNALSRVLQTSSLPATTVDKVRYPSERTCFKTDSMT